MMNAKTSAAKKTGSLAKKLASPVKRTKKARTRAAVVKKSLQSPTPMELLQIVQWYELLKPENPIKNLLPPEDEDYEPEPEREPVSSIWAREMTWALEMAERLFWISAKIADKARVESSEDVCNQEAQLQVGLGCVHKLWTKAAHWDPLAKMKNVTQEFIQGTSSTAEKSHLEPTAPVWKTLSKMVEISESYKTETRLKTALKYAGLNFPPPELGRIEDTLITTGQIKLFEAYQKLLLREKENGKKKRQRHSTSPNLYDFGDLGANPTLDQEIEATKKVSGRLTKAATQIGLVARAESDRSA